jgi:tRNA (Thr-GGU) A37 N-methylase
MTEAGFEVLPVGKVQSPLTDRASAPLQGHEGSPEAWLVFAPSVREGLEGIRPLKPLLTPGELEVSQTVS